MIHRVQLRSATRLWWDCPDCGHANDVQKVTVSEAEMREGLGIPPWERLRVPEGFTIRVRNRCEKCECLVDVTSEDDD